MEKKQVSQTHNVFTHSLSFADKSTYHGQVWDAHESKPAAPHGYGRMTTKEGFVMEGVWLEGKTNGPGKFTAPNGEVFYGVWENHKRHGKGVLVRKDGQQLIQQFELGKMVGKTVKRKPKEDSYYWDVPQCTGPAPQPRCGHTATLIRNMLIIFGGITTTSDGRSVALADLSVLEFPSLTWRYYQTSGTQPPPRYGHTATAVGRRMVVIGGQNGMEVYSSVHVFDTDAGAWSCPVAKGINLVNHTANLVGDNIVVIVQGSVFLLNTVRWDWQEVQTSSISLRRLRPSHIISQSAVSVGDSIVVYGGKLLGSSRTVEDENYNVWERCSHETLLLKVDTMEWQRVETAQPKVKPAPISSAGAYAGLLYGDSETPRCEHCALLCGSKMLVIGGYATCNPKMNVIDTSYLADVQVLDLITWTWESPQILHSLLTPRSMHTATLVGNDIYVFGGRNHAWDETNDLIRLHLPQAGKVAAASKEAKQPSSLPPAPVSSAPIPPPTAQAQPPSQASAPPPSSASFRPEETSDFPVQVVQQPARMATPPQQQQQQPQQQAPSMMDFYKMQMGK